MLDTGGTETSEHAAVPEMEQAISRVENGPIRVTICQPGLPKYRIPIFAELASRPGIDLRVLYASVKNLKNAAPRSFKAELFEHRTRVVAGKDIVWFSEHLAAAHLSQSDVVVLPWNIGHLSLLPTLVRARWNGVGTVLWGHGVSKSDTLIRRTMRWRVGRMADAVMFYNNWGAGKYLEFEKKRECVFVAQNALDQTAIQTERKEILKNPARLAAFTRDKGIGDPNLIFVSRLFDDNRVDLLLKAVKRISEHFPGITAVIIGEGPAEASLRELASQLGIADKILFVGSVYEERDLAPYFLSADLFVYPTNLGLSILHAFGYGVPVVAGDLLYAHNPEVEALENGHNGILFRHLDDADMADKIIALLKNPAQIVSMSLFAHETAMKRFTVKRMVDGMEAAIRYANRFAKPRR